MKGAGCKQSHSGDTEADAENTKTSAHHTTRNMHNAGLADLKLEKVSVEVSGMDNMVAVALSFSAKSPDATPTATRKAFPGIFQMEPAPEKTNIHTALRANLHTKRTNGHRQVIRTTD